MNLSYFSAIHFGRSSTFHSFFIKEASPDIEVGKVVDIELIVVLSSLARINIELWILVVSNKRLGADEMITPS